MYTCMYVCMYVCIYIYIYIHKHMHTYIYIYYTYARYVIYTPLFISNLRMYVKHITIYVLYHLRLNILKLYHMIRT